MGEVGGRWGEGVGGWRKMEEGGREVGGRCREVEKDGGRWERGGRKV